MAGSRKIETMIPDEGGSAVAVSDLRAGTEIFDEGEKAEQMGGSAAGVARNHIELVEMVDEKGYD